MPKKKQPDTEFGERLMALRQSRGFTQVQLAEAIGASQRIISRLETVAEFPTVPILIQLAKTLRVSSDELLGLKSPPRIVVPQPLPNERRLLKQLRQVSHLPEKDKRAVIRLINTVAGRDSG